MVRRYRTRAWDLEGPQFDSIPFSGDYHQIGSFRARELKDRTHFRGNTPLASPSQVAVIAQRWAGVEDWSEQNCIRAYVRQTMLDQLGGFGLRLSTKPRDGSEVIVSQEEMGIDSALLHLAHANGALA